MKEKTLFKLALTCSIIGLCVLFFISDNIVVKEIDVGKIDFDDIGKEVRVIGKIIRVSDTDKVMFLEVSQEKIEDVTVVLFKDEVVVLKEGDYVELIGTLDEYNGEINIIANAMKMR